MAARAADVSNPAGGYYVYGVVPAGAGLGAAGLAGVDPRFAVDVLTCGGLGVIVSEVAPSEFEGEQLEANLNRPEWIEARVRTHAAVLERALAAGGVVPMRFGTIFRSRDSLENHVFGEHERLARTLARLRGKREWGVRCLVDDNRLAAAIAENDEEARRLAAEIDRQPEGTAFFTRKKLERRVRQQADEVVASQVAGAHLRLAAVSDATTTAGTGGTPARPSRGAARVVLNSAYLVDEVGEERFRQAFTEAAAELRPFGFELELTGPWPAYNFVSDEGDTR